MVDKLAKHIGGLTYWVPRNLLQSPQNQCDRYHHLHRHYHYHQNHYPLGGQVHRTLVNHPPKQEITKRMNMCWSFLCIIFKKNTLKKNTVILRRWRKETSSDYSSNSNVANKWGHVLFKVWHKIGGDTYWKKCSTRHCWIFCGVSTCAYIVLCSKRYIHRMAIKLWVKSFGFYSIQLLKRTGSLALVRLGCVRMPGQKVKTCCFMS